MGGTELQRPVEIVLSSKSSSEYLRSMFILTDGSISNTERLFEYIEDNCSTTRIHSFGIGSGASRYLVEGIANKGKGTATMVQDEDQNLNEKVIRALSLSSRSRLANISVDWHNNKDSVIFETPRIPDFPNIFEEEPVKIYAILSEDRLKKDKVAVNLFSDLEQKEISFNLFLDPSEIIETEDDFNFSLAAKKQIEQIKRFNIEELTQSILDLSLKYSVLSDETAFFGKIKNKENSGEEMQTFQIPVKRLKPYMNKYKSIVCGCAPIRAIKRGQILMSASMKAFAGSGSSKDKAKNLWELERKLKKIKQILFHPKVF
jgi:hypothetical protein